MIDREHAIMLAALRTLARANNLTAIAALQEAGLSAHPPIITMSGRICPRCHVRYLPLAGACACGHVVTTGEQGA